MRAVLEMVDESVRGRSRVDEVRLGHVWGMYAGGTRVAAAAAINKNRSIG
jgi:hypothetical protein